MATLTPWWCCFSPFVQRDCFVSGRRSRIGREDIKGKVIKNHSRLDKNLKPKDLLGIPWMLAFALRADGWWLRSDIIWSKSNPMPESVTDRPTKAHEYLFLLTKRASYYYDAEAIREPQVEPGRIQIHYSKGYTPGNGDKRDAGIKVNKPTQESPGYNPSGRNRRTVWTIATEPFPGSHFATFPQALVKPCLLAGSSDKGVCPRCGAPWERVVEKEFTATSAGRANITGQEFYNGWEGVPRGSNSVTTLGWRATCACDAGDPVPAVVLDPFAGSGTVGLVAKNYGRRFVGLDLKLDASGIEVNTQSMVSILLGGVAAIDHVEVYKNGGSAVYGSDAIAGVINFVIKDSYQGATATLYGGGTKSAPT